MKAEIISIGDEILIGQIQNSNATWIAKELNKIGIQVHQITSISDEEQHILKTLTQAQRNASIVIITGGLGPTRDDITKKSLVSYFNDRLTMNHKILKHIEKLLAALNMSITDAQKDQALLPSKAHVMKNYYGTASGMWFERDNKVVVALPGVPFEMKALLKDATIPLLKEKFDTPFILHKTIYVYGEGESNLASRIESWENGLPDFIKLAYLPAPGRVRLRMSAVGKCEETVTNAVSEQTTKLQKLLQGLTVSYDENIPIEAVVGKLLNNRKQTIATAESFTGGNIAHLFTSVPGSSAYFKGSVISYATSVKKEVLGVNPKIIAKHTVVSAQVAKAMALGVQSLLKADFAIATTGVAGPDKGEDGKEPGTAFIAIATPQNVLVSEHYFGQPREKVIQKASLKAFELLKETLQKKTP